MTIRQRASLRDLIDWRYQRSDWTPIPYCTDGAADVAETTYKLPFQTKPDAAPVRLIVRRVKPTPGSQLALGQIQLSRLHHRPRWGDARELEADHRRHAEVKNAIRDLKYGVGLNHMPSARFAANGAWLAVQVMAHNLARFHGADWSGRADRDHQDPQAAMLRSVMGRITRSARRLTLLGSPGAGHWEIPRDSSVAPWPGCKPFRSRPDGQPALDPTSPQCVLAPPRSRESPAAYPLAIPRIATPA